MTIKFIYETEDNFVEFEAQDGMEGDWEQYILDCDFGDPEFVEAINSGTIGALLAMRNDFERLTDEELDFFIFCIATSQMSVINEHETSEFFEVYAKSGISLFVSGLHVHSTPLCEYDDPETKSFNDCQYGVNVKHNIRYYDDEVLQSVH